MNDIVRTAFAGPGGDDVSIAVGGRAFTAWKSVTISRGIGKAASAFAVDMSRKPRYVDRPGVNAPLKMGDVIEVRIGGELVLTGRVERVAPVRGPDRRALKAQGRSLTGALVSSSAAQKPGKYDGVTVPHLARILAKPFGVEIVAPADAGAAFKTFEIEQGETVHAAIVRAAHNRGMELTDDGEGRLVLIRPGAAAVSPPELHHLDGPDGAPDPDNNVIVSSGKFSFDNRFRTIEVRTQKDPDAYEKISQAAAVSGRASDPGITWPSHLVIVSDTQMTQAEAIAQARYEVTRRAGESTVYTPEVAGWRRSAGGPLWAINRLHRVRDVVQGLDMDMLMTEVAFRMDGDNGHTSALTLQPPSAFAGNPEDLRDEQTQLAWDALRQQFEGVTDD